MKKSTKIEVLKGAFAIMILAVTLFPIYWMVVTSLEPWELVLVWPPSFIPKQLTLEYWEWAGSRFTLPLRNSLIIAGITTILSVVLGLPAGYSFARFHVGRRTLPFWILSLRFLPGIVPSVAFYILFRTLNILDTYLAVIIAHTLITLPFSIWMFKVFIEALPRELEEAALIDGCTYYQVVRRIVLPLTLPSIAVVALFSFTWSWNEFMMALILTKSQAYTLPVMIAGFRGAGMIWGGVSAGALLSLIPAIILAVFFQRYLVSGLTMGAVKG
jgi:multiple sugar transport system permease protein